MKYRVSRPLWDEMRFKMEYLCTCMPFIFLLKSFLLCKNFTKIKRVKRIKNCLITGAFILLECYHIPLFRGRLTHFSLYFFIYRVLHQLCDTISTDVAHYLSNLNTVCFYYRTFYARLHFLL
ncbi:hypothetical protein RF11_04135 [Thelohanellus kitauei]|uniref:Uncharacterized protein n=1 Tax=Thelohanellus kitauei TaxID=669202 RepID=A0A0C2N1B2_THEKT|nr:hypothetical protein RF11_04135 [Thelohanellus kitauei]